MRKDRGGSQRDRIERAGLDFHERVASAFENSVSSEWQRAHPECGPITGVDGIGTEAEVAARMEAAVENRWPGLLAERN
jgi:hypothetical protein